ncbi:Uncharacterised protein [Mycobacteroides abscessus subsp. massiliense]|nr:Uncharacterised protein [Mycobacteroides abscessus subsp. massiliense]
MSRSNSATVVVAVARARTGTVLISRPTTESAPVNSAGRPDTTVPKAMSCAPVCTMSNCAHAARRTVLTVVCCERARSPKARVVSGEIRYDATPRGPGTDRGATSVGASKPSRALRHAAHAASRSC